MNALPSSASDAVRDYVNDTAVADDHLVAARDAAAEYGLTTPDAMTGEFLTFLAARAGSARRHAARGRWTCSGPPSSARRG